MYLIIKRSKYDTQKDSFTVVNDECFNSLDSANSYAMHLGDSEKRKNVTYTVIRLTEVTLDELRNGYTHKYA